MNSQQAKHRLLAKLVELRDNGSKNRAGVLIEKCADPMDQIDQAQNLFMVVTGADREAKIIRDINAALRRIEDGEWGLCVDCEEEISPKRLEAVPWASRCVACQEKQDALTVHEAEELFEEAA